jgi:hypothetical protein
VHVREGQHPALRRFGWIGLFPLLSAMPSALIARRLAGLIPACR